jgi:hypothetical protein
VYKSLANGAQFSMWHMGQWTLMAVVHSLICVIVLEVRRTPFYSHICTGTGPHLRRDRARPCRVCTGTALAAAA